MKIEWVQLVNYRCHENLRVDFGPGFNVVAGINGSGKTSLLKGLGEVLGGLLAAFGGTGTSVLADRSDVRVQVEEFSGRLRFEPQYPVELRATVAFDGQAVSWAWRRKSELGMADSVGGAPDSELAAWRTVAVAEPGSASGDNQVLPIFAFYQADRNWPAYSADMLQAAIGKSARLDGYASWANASVDASRLQLWVIAKCLERLQLVSETGRRFSDIDDDELASVNAALSEAAGGVVGLKFDMQRKSLLVEWSGEDGTPAAPTPFEQLSDGQRALICLVADIARRMCLLNPALGTAVAKQTPGVVLIDELDIHLHPRWQRMITRGLKRAFPAVQFIAASHSPQILGELRPDEILLLEAGVARHPQVSYGLDSSRVLDEIMDAPARTPEVEEALAGVFDSLELNDLPAARARLQSLRELAPGIAELDGAEALLKRKELLGR